jgi:hypothetical protein
LQRRELWQSEACANSTQFTGAFEPYKYPSAKRNRRGDEIEGAQGAADGPLLGTEDLTGAHVIPGDGLDQIVESQGFGPCGGEAATVQQCSSATVQQQQEL